MKEIWLYFLKLGCLGFGGPLALLGEMQSELIEKRRWLSDEEFRHAFALIKAMPGPLAYQVAVFLGRARAGFWGGICAGIAFVLPSFAMMLACAYLFDAYAKIQGVDAFLVGMQITALGVIVASLKGLIKPNAHQKLFWLLLVTALPFCWFFSAFEPLLIVGFGVVSVMMARLSPQVRLAEAATPLLALMWVGVKAGALVFGTGLAIVPLLEYDVVTRHQWLTHEAFMSALAFGQVTPGPVVITTTFIGFKVASLTGAVVATVAVFAPCTFHMLTWFPRLVGRLSRLTWIEPFIRGAIAAVVASIAVTIARLGWGLHPNGAEIMLMIIAFVLTLRGLAPVWSLIPAGGVAVLLLKLGGYA